jgi:hypothetical protein
MAKLTEVMAHIVWHMHCGPSTCAILVVDAHLINRVYDAVGCACHLRDSGTDCTALLSSPQHM